MAEEEGVEQLADQLLFLRVERLCGLEGEAEIAARTTLRLVEEQRVGGGGQAAGELDQSVDRGLRDIGLVPADLADVDASSVGESLLGHAPSFTECDETFWEGHVRERG